MTLRTKKYWANRVSYGVLGQMNWSEHFSARTRLFRKNTVREFLKLAGQPGIISLAGGLPDAELLPVKELGTAAEKALRRFGHRALQYGPSEGLPELRERIAARYRAVGAKAENVLVTSGSQQALDLLGRVFLNSGNTVLVQNPTYLAALSAWSPFGAEFRTASRSGFSARPAFAYCIPNFRNPSGETMPESERLDWLNHCRKDDVPLVEDDAYGELRYEGAAQRSILELGGTLEGPVLHVGTFSKVLSPGLRIGWVIAPPEVVGKLVQARQAADLHTSSFAQAVAFEAVEQGTLERVIPAIRAAYRMKRDQMLEALGQAMPPRATWSKPEGGMFIMLRFAPGTDARKIAERALARGLLVVPGEEFHIEGGTETIRLNFSHPSVAQIREGVRILARAATEN